MSDIDRTDFGISEDDMGFDKDKSSKIFSKPIADSFDDILNNPANKVFLEFEKEFKKNDVETLERFKELNVCLQAFTKTLEDNPQYDFMDIVTMMRELLVRYNVFATTLRQSAFLSKDKMKEIHEIVTNYYIPLGELQFIKANLEEGVVDKDGKIIAKKKYKLGQKLKLMEVGDE